MIDRILYNGNFITLDSKFPRVEAIAMTNGRIVAYGYGSDIMNLGNANTVRENLGGKTVIPGLIDAHIHWLWTSRTLQEVDVFEVPSRQVAVRRVAERAAMLPKGEWIMGQGWSQDMWDDRAFPTAADLDAVAPHHPVYLRAKSAHAFWVNSAALAACGIDQNTPDPEGGHIGRDEHGRPNGMLFEMASKLITQHIPPMAPERVAELMIEAQKLALARGLTGIHDYDGPDCLQALQIVRERDQLNLRVVKNINKEWIDHAIQTGLRWGFGDEWIRIGGLKIFADGALGPRTAWMIDPYESEPENIGLVVTPPDEMLRCVSEASAAGLPSTIHAIGDRAVREVLNVYEQVRREEARRGVTPDQRRHRIEHVQVIHPDDVSRLASLKIIASMQPIHATSDYRMSDRYWGERSRLAYNARVQIDQGVITAFGSDSPVEPFDPFEGIYAAVTRRRADGSPGADGWYPEARLTVEEALRGYTRGPAYAGGMEKHLGKLAPGFLADLVVLDHDLYKVAPEQIREIQVEATMVGGDWCHGGV